MLKAAFGLASLWLVYLASIPLSNFWYQWRAGIRTWMTALMALLTLSLCAGGALLWIHFWIPAIILGGLADPPV